MHTITLAQAWRLFHAGVTVYISHEQTPLGAGRQHKPIAYVNQANGDHLLATMRRANMYKVGELLLNKFKYQVRQVSSGKHHALQPR